MPCYAAHLQNGEMILSTKHEHQVGEMQFMAQLFRLGTVRLVGFLPFGITSGVLPSPLNPLMFGNMHQLEIFGEKKME